MRRGSLGGWWILVLAALFAVVLTVAGHAAVHAQAQHIAAVLCAWERQWLSGHAPHLRVQ
jgi:hypothetical protein